MTRDGRVCPVREVLAVDAINDLLILQVEGDGFTPLPIATGVEQGASVWVLSHPEFEFYTFTSGTVSGYYTLTSNEGEWTLMNITADVATGSSGAPVFNENGAVVGIARQIRNIWSKDKERQMVTKSCIPSSALLKLTGSKHD
jgi:S1-C subfamily serine protease